MGKKVKQTAEKNESIRAKNREQKIIHRDIQENALREEQQFKVGDRARVTRKMLRHDGTTLVEKGQVVTVESLDPDENFLYVVVRDEKGETFWLLKGCLVNEEGRMSPQDYKKMQQTTEKNDLVALKDVLDELDKMRYKRELDPKSSQFKKVTYLQKLRHELRVHKKRGNSDAFSTIPKLKAMCDKVAAKYGDKYKLSEKCT